MSSLSHPFEETCDLIVCADEEEWLRYRKSYMTASSAAALIGKHPFKTREEVIEAKVYGSDFVPNGRTWFGNHRETCNIQAFEHLAGYEVETRLNHHLLVNKKHPWMACTIDGYVVRGRDKEGPKEMHLPLPPLAKGTLVEAKNVQSKSRSLWNKDKLSPRLFMYWAQVQYQLAVTEENTGILFAAVDACEMYAHVVEADVAFQARLVDESKTAMEEVAELDF